MRTLGIDADILIFNISEVCTIHCEWDDDLWSTGGDMKAAKSMADTKVESLLNDSDCGKASLCFTSSNNWRNDVLPTYKANRKSSRKPFLFPLLREWCLRTFDCVTEDRLEADDLLGLLSNSYDVIASDDKDLDQIPGEHISIWKEPKLRYEILPEQARRYHLQQTLEGDLTDNYKGCPGIGKVKAGRILDQGCDWESVLDAYQKQELTEEDALVQARVARILQPGEYDWESKEVKLWSPGGAVRVL